MASVEVLAGPATSGGGEQKQAIVAAAFGPGAVVRRGATGRRDAEFDLSLAAGSSSRGQWVRSGVVARAGDGVAIPACASDRDRIRGQRPCGSRLRCRPLCGGCRRGVSATMIPVPSGVRVWPAVGRTDMRKGMDRLALQVQQALGCDPHAGDLYVFRGARGDLLKISRSKACWRHPAPSHHPWPRPSEYAFRPRD